MRREDKFRELFKVLKSFDYIVVDFFDMEVLVKIRDVLVSMGIRKFDLFINNVGYVIRKFFLEYFSEEFENIFRVNVFVFIWFMKEFFLFFGKGLKVVFVISGVVFVNVFEIFLYCVIKGVFYYFMINLEKELVELGISMIRVYFK